jgi:hypothetical protein
VTATINSSGDVLPLDGARAPEEAMTEEDAADPARVARVITRLLKGQAELERRRSPERIDFEDVVISSSAPVQLQHGMGGRVRYSLQDMSRGGGLAPTLARASSTDEDTLVLDAYQPVAIYLTADFTTTSATAQNTALTFPVRNGEVWMLEYWGFAGCSTVNGMCYAIGAPTGTVVDGILDSSLGAATTDARVQITAVNTLTSAVHTVAGGQRDDYINARLAIVGNGSVTIQAASATGGDTTTIRDYACVLAVRLRAASTTFAATTATIRVEAAG